MKEKKIEALHIIFSGKEVRIYKALRKFVYEHPGQFMSVFMKEATEAKLKELKYL